MYQNAHPYMKSCVTQKSADVGYHTECYRRFTAMPNVIDQTCADIVGIDSDPCWTTPLLQSKTTTLTD